MQLGSRSKGRPVCLPNELIAVLVGYASSAGNYPVCGPCTLAYEMDNPCSHSSRIFRASVIISLDCPLPVLPTAPRICCVYDPKKVFPVLPSRERLTKRRKLTSNPVKRSH